MSGPLAGTQAINGPVTVAAFARSPGFAGRYQIDLPADATEARTISHDHMSNDGPEHWADRTISIDQYTGRVLADMRLADCPVYRQAMGIAFHEGDLGVWEMDTLFCLS